MKNKNLIWLGLGAVALYLYFKNKSSASAVTPKVEPNPSVPITFKSTGNKDLDIAIAKKYGQNYIPKDGDEVSIITTNTANKYVYKSGKWQTLGAGLISPQGFTPNDVLNFNRDSSVQKLDCNWVKNEILQREAYKKRISDMIKEFTDKGLPPPQMAYAGPPTYSIEQYDVAKRCGLNLPSS
jgi:hypothetical protein